MGTPKISELMEDFLDPAPGHGPQDTLRALEESGHRFALLRATDAPPSGAAAVAGLLTTGSRDASAGPGPVITIDAEPELLDGSALLALADEFAYAGAAGVIVMRDGEPAGVIGRDTLIDAMPLHLLAAGRQRQGTPAVSSLRYQCTRCAPPSVRLLRAAPPDDRPPLCPRDFFHGAMERAAL